MGNQDKFTLLIRKSKPFLCLLVDDRSHKSTSPSCWCFRNSVLYNATPLLHEVFLIMRLNAASVPDASTAALLMVLLDPSHLLDISGRCSLAPRMGFEVTRQRSRGTLWQVLVFQMPLMGLVPFQTKRVKMLRRIWSTFRKRCKRKKAFRIFCCQKYQLLEKCLPLDNVLLYFLVSSE